MVLGPQNGATVFAMRHQKKIAKLGRPADQRKALIRGLVTEVWAAWMTAAAHCCP